VTNGVTNAGEPTWDTTVSGGDDVAYELATPSVGWTSGQPEEMGTRSWSA
jgi:hypothetical protein